MIFTLTYMHMPPRPGINVARFGENPKWVDAWPAVKKCLEGTGDTIIFVVTRIQMPDFLNRLKEHGLDKYLIVDHRGSGSGQRGVTNRNYPDDKLKLKLFVLKGAKQSA